MPTRATDDAIHQIIDALDGLAITDQLACLITMMFSHVVSAAAAAQQPQETADTIIDSIARNLPLQWQAARSMLLHGSLPN